MVHRVGLLLPAFLLAALVGPGASALAGETGAECPSRRCRGEKSRAHRLWQMLSGEDRTDAAAKPQGRRPARQVALTRKCPDPDAPLDPEAAKCKCRDLRPCESETTLGDDNAPLRLKWTSALGGARVTRIMLAPPGFGRTLRAGVRPDDDSNPDKYHPYIFVTTADHRLGCIDSAGGDLLWWVPMGGELLEAPALSPNGMYYIAKQMLNGVDIGTGKPMFRLPLKFAPVGGLGVIADGGKIEDADEKEDAVTVWKDSLLIAGMDGRIRRVDIATAPWPPEVTGQFRKIREDMRMIEKHVVVRWAVRMRHPGTAFGRVMMGRADHFAMLASDARSQAAHLYAWDLSPDRDQDDEFRIRNAQTLPRELGSFRTQRIVDAPPVLAEELVMLSSLDGNLYAVHIATNDLAWRRPFGHALTQSAQYMEDTEANPPIVLQRVVGPTDSDTAMIAVAFADGRPVWPAPRATRVVARMGESMENNPLYRTFAVTANSDGTLSAIRMRDGEELWCMQYDPAAAFCDNTREPLVFALVDDGKTLQALEPQQ